VVASSRTTEVFTAAAVLAVLGTAWLTEQAGLSLALGAFLAGLMLADSHYRHQVIADTESIECFRKGYYSWYPVQVTTTDPMNHQDEALGACRTLDVLLWKSGYRPDVPLDLVK
jgi:predicted Kef-type K+ transport protein